MKQYLAHIRRDGSAKQTMRAHLLRVGDLMAASAAGIGLSATARLIGVLHDLGKCTKEFADYLDYCRKHPGDYSRKGEVDHSSAGGQLLMKKYGRLGEDECLVVQMAVLVIFSHHARGLKPKCLGLLQSARSRAPHGMSEKLVFLRQLLRDKSLAAKLCSEPFAVEEEYGRSKNETVGQAAVSVFRGMKQRGDEFVTP
ncbi:MAG: CRISPR-associated endonuclease Cas3'' [Centipeda sp. (in: firmicutes)]